jgi:hypothetical protein
LPVPEYVAAFDGNAAMARATMTELKRETVFIGNYFAGSLIATNMPQIRGFA